MTDEDIRKAAWDLWDASWEQSPRDAVEAVYRAGMEAGRAEAAAAKPKRRKAAEPHGGSYRPGFTRFWAAWPPSTRKGGKAECLKLWEAQKLEERAREVITHVGYMVMSQDWLKDGGAFIPAPAVYLRQKRWDGAEMPVGPVAAPESARAREARERVERIAPGAARRQDVRQELHEVIENGSQPRIS